jgi:ABC-2 type transport system ATP-binding protein
VTAPPPPAVEVNGLTRSFGAVTALDHINFQVSPGELFGVVGPDGAGKTTLQRILAGVLRPSAGDAHILGISVALHPEAVKPHLAYMAQRFGLYEDLTVEENLDFYADLYGVPKADLPARKERLYRFSRLGEFSGRLAGALSGGMKQKLSLSCCLIHHPRILLLDEPTFGVDPISRRELWLILHEMVAEGITVVVSTSYLDEAERCDRVLLLDGGRVLALDTPAALRRSLPGTLLEVEVDDPRRGRDLLRGRPEITGASLFGERLHVLVAAGDGGGIAGSGSPVPDAVEKARGLVRDVLSAAGLTVLGAVPAEPSLEDVFIHRVQEAAASSRGAATPSGAAAGHG